MLTNSSDFLGNGAANNGNNGSLHKSWAGIKAKPTPKDFWDLKLEQAEEEDRYNRPVLRYGKTACRSDRKPLRKGALYKYFGDPDYLHTLECAFSDLYEAESLEEAEEIFRETLESIEQWRRRSLGDKKPLQEMMKISLAEEESPRKKGWTAFGPYEYEAYKRSLIYYGSKISRAATLEETDRIYDMGLAWQRQFRKHLQKPAAPDGLFDDIAGPQPEDVLSVQEELEPNEVRVLLHDNAPEDANTFEVAWQATGVPEDIARTWREKLKDDGLLKKAFENGEIVINRYAGDFSLEGPAVGSGRRCSAGAFRRALELLSESIGEHDDGWVFTQIMACPYLAGPDGNIADLHCRDLLDCDDVAANRQVWFVGCDGAVRLEGEYDSREQPLMNVFNAILKVAPKAAHNIARDFTDALKKAQE